MAEQHSYIVTYDICDPKRLRRVFKELKAWGVHIQYSVFQCNLTEQQRIELESELEELINNHVDQVLLIRIGPAQGRASVAITALGKAFGVKEVGGGLIV